MPKTIERVQTGVRLEKRLLKVLKGLAEHLDLSLGDLLEGMALHFGRGPCLADEDQDEDQSLGAQIALRVEPGPSRARSVRPPSTANTKRSLRSVERALVLQAGLLDQPAP